MNVALLQGILLSQNAKTIALFKEIAERADICVSSRNKMVNFLLDIQENGFQVAVIEFKHGEEACLQWVRLIRRMRPKLPLIVICENIAKTTEAQLHEENIFYLGLQPLQKETLTVVLKSAVRQKKNIHTF